MVLSLLHPSRYVCSLEPGICVTDNTILREPWPRNPGAEAALQPLIWCSESLLSQGPSLAGGLASSVASWLAGRPASWMADGWAKACMLLFVCQCCNFECPFSVVVKQLFVVLFMFIGCFMHLGMAGEFALESS